MLKKYPIIERLPNYSRPRCTCQAHAELEIVHKPVVFKGTRHWYDQGVCDYYYHCPVCGDDWVLSTPKKIKIIKEI